MGLFDWLKFKKATAAPANSWKPGDRVIAKKPDSYFYPGMVREVNEVGCMVSFDDGEAYWVHFAHVLNQDIQIGSRVFCKTKNAPHFAPGTVNQRKGETILVSYDHGEEEWTSISMIRVQRPIANVNPDALAGMNAPVKQSLDLGEPLKDNDWRIGDRVLARWLDFFWYPGSILNMGTRGIHIYFDNGEQRVVQQIGIMPLIVEEGEHLFIRPKDEPQRMYSPAVVLRVDGEILDVEYEDGTHESNTRVTRARFWRCPIGVPNFRFQEGERVLAYDCDDCVYPAEIVSIDDDKVLVQYLDGPERMVTPELIKRFDVKPGLKIESRWAGGPHYFPGTLSKMESERIFVKYEDGDEEWTSIRLFRIPPKKPE
jgi:hypothetical protein